MVMCGVFWLLLVLYSLCNVQGLSGQRPEQIHLSYGVDPTRMVVTWSSQPHNTASICYYKVMDGTELLRATGVSTKFSQGYHTQFIHRVTLDRLKPGIRYAYWCGDENEMSDVYSFKSMNEGTDWVPQIAFYGDLGVENDKSIPLLKQDIIKDMYDAILHIGDLAYNLDADSGFIGDQFMDNIQPLATFVPYMTAPGNHEMRYNFSNYKNRFTMPTDETTKNMFYSFDIGPAHIISFCTEYYFFTEYGMEQILRQFYWLEKDLKKANKNRHIRPWIIVMGHKPMYCSNSDHDDCTMAASVIRNGFIENNVTFFGLEKLFFEQGVDLTLWAHEHSYERLWPVYNEEVRNGSVEEPYTNPGAPVHIITGSAGCWSKHNPFINKQAAWSAFRTTDYGYSRMYIHNASHMYLQQFSVDQERIVDDFWLIKDKHQPYRDINPAKNRKPVQYKDFLKLKNANKFKDPVKFVDPFKDKDRLKVKPGLKLKNPLKFKSDFQYGGRRPKKMIKL